MTRRGEIWGGGVIAFKARTSQALRDQINTIVIYCVDFGTHFISFTQAFTYTQ